MTIYYSHTQDENCSDNVQPPLMLIMSTPLKPLKPSKWACTSLLASADLDRDIFEAAPKIYNICEGIKELTPLSDHTPYRTADKLPV